MKFWLIAIFGVIGVFGRYGLGLFIARFAVPPFPYGTFIINIIGAFFIGLVYALGVERAVIPMDVRIGIMVGLLGGFTTFSSYCLETFQLVSEAEYMLAAIYLFVSPCLGFIAAVLGVAIGRFGLRFI